MKKEKIDPNSLGELQSKVVTIKRVTKVVKAAGISVLRPWWSWAMEMAILDSDLGRQWKFRKPSARARKPRRKI